MRRLAANGVVFAASLAAALGAAEIVLRVLQPTARQPFVLRESLESERGKFCIYDPQLGWTGKPDVDADFHFVDCEHRVRQNRYGFRGTEHALERTARPRLVVLGDSFVWGFGVEDDEIFTSVLERESEPPLEVVNLGVSGYGTDQQLLLWRSLGRRFRPDVVLLVLCPYTDLVENLSAEAYGYAKPIFRFTEHGHRIANQPVPESRPDAWQAGRTESDAAAAELAQRPALARLAARSALVGAGVLAFARLEEPRRLLERRRILPVRDHAFSWQSLAHVEPPSPHAAAAWRTLFRLVDLVHDDVVASGARLELLVVPSVIQVYPELWEEFVRANPPPAGARWSRDAPNVRIAAFARVKGIPVVDPLDDLRAAARTNLFLYFPWNSHWTAAGHRLVADRLSSPPPARAAPARSDDRPAPGKEQGS